MISYCHNSATTLTSISMHTITRHLLVRIWWAFVVNVCMVNNKCYEVRVWSCKTTCSSYNCSLQFEDLTICERSTPEKKAHIYLPKSWNSYVAATSQSIHKTIYGAVAVCIKIENSYIVV